jgi:hypothetical protein
VCDFMGYFLNFFSRRLRWFLNCNRCAYRCSSWSCSERRLQRVRPATRVAISLLISWTFQLFVKSSN